MSEKSTRTTIVQALQPQLNTLKQVISTLRIEGQIAPNSAVLLGEADRVSSILTSVQTLTATLATRSGPGRPRGPAGFRDEQEFLAVLADLIRTTHAKEIDPTQTRIAEFLRPEIDRRRNTGSAASLEDPVESTVKLIRNHIPVLWSEFVQNAFSSKK